MNKIEIIPIEYGKSTLPESMIFQNGAKDAFRRIVFMIYLVKTADRLILIDAGCETMPGFVMEDFCGSVAALEKIKIKPEDITDVVITHSHHDHIECVKYFNNAAVYIQQDEYESGKDYLDGISDIKQFSDEAEIADGIKAVKIGGHSIGSCIVEITSDAEKYIIAGDEIYMRDCIRKQIPTGASYNIKKSTHFIDKYCNGEYTVLLFHDK